MASADNTPARLDPDQLDKIVQGLDLSEADFLDRMRLSVQSFMREFWDWLKAVSGGEGGWLDRGTDAVQQWFEDYAGEAVPAETILNGIYYTALAILVGLIMYGLYRAWRLFQPVSPANSNFGIASLGPELLKPLSKLPKELWTAAMFSQVCQALARQGRLRLQPDTTNATIVSQAEVNDQVRSELRMLANAADRALFAAWMPDDEELASLRMSRDRLLDALGEHA